MGKESLCGSGLVRQSPAAGSGGAGARGVGAAGSTAERRIMRTASVGGTGGAKLTVCREKGEQAGGMRGERAPTRERYASELSCGCFSPYVL